MISFRVLKKSKNSSARLGVIKTPHGEVETPAFVPVATQATVKTLDSLRVRETGTQILIANTFHLHLKPGEEIIKKNGGLHKFMNWPKPLMTDSAGFQVFSFGFGRDYETGKVLKNQNSSHKSSLQKITVFHKPQKIKITNQGVYFQSPLDGKEIFIGPQESIRIQEKLGADIIFAFDECPSPLADYYYNQKALERTHAWAKICLKTKKTNQALFGIVQGGKYKDLRKTSANFIGSLDFDGFGIGGEFGIDKKSMRAILKVTINELPSNKPRHLLGIGHLEDILLAVKEGVDTFDCIVPTHYARHGYAFVGKIPENLKGAGLSMRKNKIDLNKRKYLKENKPLDKYCNCFVCQNYSRSYICHLLKAKEITALSLLTFHNLYFFNKYLEKIRKEIKKGNL